MTTSAAELATSPSLLVRTLVLMAGLAVIGCNSMLLSPILADVAASLHSTAVVVSRSTAAYGAATALSALLLAPRIDRWGARRGLLAGVACFALGMIVCAAAWHWLVLALGQVLAGVAAGLMLPATYSLTAVVSPPGQESRLLGRVLAGWSLAMVGGVPLASLLADGLDWRAAYGALALLTLAILPCLRWLPEHRAASGPRRRQALFAALRYRTVPRLLTVCLCYMMAFFGVYAFVGDHLRQVLEISASQAGLLSLAYGAGFGGASLVDGVVDRFGPWRVLPLALGLLAAIYAVLAPAAGDLATVLVLAAAWGFANHVGLNILVLLLSRAEPSARAAILGLYSTTTYLGAVIGVAGCGLLYEGPGFAAMTWGATVLLGLAALLALPGLSLRGAARS